MIPNNCDKGSPCLEILNLDKGFTVHVIEVTYHDLHEIKGCVIVCAIGL
jgi:hypothetical protein